MAILRLAGEREFQFIMAEMISASFSGQPDSNQEKVIASAELFGGKKQILIRHGESLYRLLITRQGKLILNK